MTKAIWQGEVLAESEDTIVVEGNHYFPPEDVNWDYFQEADKQTVCPWKGQANYYDVVINGDRNTAAAWYYPEPSQAAAKIEDYVAFWGDVKVAD